MAVWVLSAVCALSARAQGDVQFSDYTALKSFYNPAASGVDGKLNVSAAYSMQMVGYDDAPSTMYVGVDAPVYFLTPRHGAGVSFLNDQIGMFSTSRVALQYAYNVKLGRRGRLALGFQGALVSKKLDGGKVDLEESNDPAFPSGKVDGTKVDMGAGLYYWHPQVWAGASVQHLAAPVVVVGDRYEVEVPRVYYLMGGCNIRPRNSLLSIEPSFLVQTDMAAWREDVQCKVTYEYEGRRFYGGLGYSPDVSVTFMVGGVVHGVNFGYSYQMYTSGVGIVNGSHELVAGYQADLDLFKKGRNRHKSVRWL